MTGSGCNLTEQARAELMAAGADWGRAARRRQGLPPKIEDPATLDLLADIFGSVGPTRTSTVKPTQPRTSATVRRARRQAAGIPGDAEAA